MKRGLKICCNVVFLDACQLLKNTERCVLKTSVINGIISMNKLLLLLAI